MLGPLDWIIIAVYLILTIAVGILARGRQHSAEDYFTAKGGFSGVLGSILVGLSLAATLFSGISLLAFPSLVYEHGLRILGIIVTLPIAWAVLAWFFLPRYMADDWSHPYEVVEACYGRSVRRLTATLFILMRLGWMATLIYAPTIAIMAAANLDPAWLWPVVLTIGFSSTLYTAIGGIRGVIVTDAIQFLIIIGGVLGVILYTLIRLPTPWPEAVNILQETGRLRLWDLSLSLEQPLTLWALIIGYTVHNLGSYMGDQLSLQRYITAGNLRSAGQSFATNAVSSILVLLLLAGVGLALAAWYGAAGGAHLPSNVDQIFPYFVAHQLPVGVAGLLLAALLAATMSSMTSGINALAGAITLDWRPQNSRRSPAQELRLGRWLSLLIGVAATFAGGLVGKLGTLFEIVQILGAFAGPLGVCVLFSTFRVRVPASAMSLAMLAGCTAGGLTAMAPYLHAHWPWFPNVYALWVTPLAFLVTVAIAFAGRWINPAWRDVPQPSQALEDAGS